LRGVATVFERLGDVADIGGFVDLLERLLRDVVGVQSLLVVLGASGVERSEEHTSELQSRFGLVCRLLLEKKQLQVLEVITEASPISLDFFPLQEVRVEELLDRAVGDREEARV